MVSIVTPDRTLRFSLDKAAKLLALAMNLPASRAKARLLRYGIVEAGQFVFVVEG